MDPQQRILMEVVYEGIESAGYTIDGLRGSQTGVFVGQMTDDFHDLLYRDVENIPQYAGSGASRAIVANRVSYFFDWHGPSMNIDTACSSSLVATHQAVQALRNGESGLAVAAGVNLILGPENYIAESKASRPSHPACLLS
jgi:acyl transferase domain-containing protein